MQQQHHEDKLGLPVADHDAHDINWLEFWPESEFRLEQQQPAEGPLDTALGVGDLLAPPPNMQQQQQQAADHSHTHTQLGMSFTDPFAAPGGPLGGLGHMGDHYKVTPVVVCASQLCATHSICFTHD